MQLDIYEDPPERTWTTSASATCAASTTRPAEIAIELARRGAYVGFDRVTLNGTMPDENRVVMAMAMIEAGYTADKLLLSSDFYSRPALKANGGPGLAQTETVFGCDAAGRRDSMTGHAARQILDDNPRRFLAFLPGSSQKDRTIS